MAETSMVFYEFTTPDRKVYFVGHSLEEIHADPAFAVIGEVTDHRILDEADVRRLDLDFVDEGIAAVNDGATSFMLRVPRT